MGGRVTDDFNTFGVAARDDGDLSVLVDHMGEVNELAVDAAGESGLGQTGTDVGGDIGNGDGGGEFALEPSGRVIATIFNLVFYRRKKCGHEPHFFALDILLDNVSLTPSIFSKRGCCCAKSLRRTHRSTKSQIKFW